jgi:lipopolysaccharide transport system ATP-binding protein
MNDIAVRVENLGKLYRIGQIVGYSTLRESLMNVAYAPFRRLRSARHKPSAKSSEPRTTSHKPNFIWALKDVSFEIKRGEAVGIIGKNGSGKTTILKILSRITAPTEGCAEIHGRVGSLLEVGTGFHPELTGRENIYLNGAVLGMKRAEVKLRFDEIVAFSEIEKFLDTPVKRYSSGMYVRLAFAVAAHLEPEILIVDEVLAVGDAAFQKKCLGKMNIVSREGRTVLFVSHNMQSVRQLCQRAILLKEGALAADGVATEVTAKYLQEIPVADTRASLEALIRSLPPDPAFRLDSIVLSQNDKPVVNAVLNGQPLDIEIAYEVKERTRGLRVFLDLCDSEGTLLFRSFHDEQADGVPTMEAGSYVSRAVIPADVLAPITYELRIQAGIFNVRMCTDQGVGIPLFVEATGLHNRAYVSDTHRGKLALAIPWSTQKQ